MEKNWAPTTKRTVVIGGVILTFLLISRVSSILPPLIFTLILAYILTPIADFVSARLRLNRTLIVAIIYLILLAAIVIIPVLLVPPLIAQIENFTEGLPELIQGIDDFIQEPLVFRDFTLDLKKLYSQTSDNIEGFLSSLAAQALGILSNIATALVWVFFILVSSFYLVKDSGPIVQWLDDVVPSPYRHDFRQLRAQIAAAWNAFLRGQLILCFTMGVVVGTTMAFIGLPYAWLIGLMFGILEFIPNLGPTIASVPTIAIALLKGPTSSIIDINISNGWYTVLVIVVNFLLQQLENNFLVPRIMGQSLNLHPLVVLVAALIGAKLAGVLGILLAAPIVATLRVLIEYAYYRLLDMPPFPKQTKSTAQPTPPTVPAESQQAK